MAILSWTPIRSGAHYCSPACGRGCTLREYTGAKHNAALLARKLGKGWTPHVWENMGWHWNAVSPSGRLKVHPNIINGKPYSFTAFLGDSGPGGQWAERGRTPRAAVRCVIKTAAADLRKIGAVLRDLP